MRSQRVARLGKPRKHELPALDKRRPDIRSHDIDAEREKTVAVWCDEPPTTIPPFRAKEPGRVKIGTLQQSAVAIQSQGRRKPLPHPLLLPQSRALKLIV